MIRGEAIWIRDQLNEIDPVSILDFGCSTRKMQHRQRFQGSILWDEWNDVTFHIDKVEDVRVDFRADLEKEMSFRRCEVVLCASLLEHVEDHVAVMKNVLTHATRAVLLTIPTDFPKHECPIDTGLRMDADQLAEYGERFGLKIHSKTQINSDYHRQPVSVACCRFDR